MDSTDTLADLARAALASRREAEILPRLQRAMAARPGDAELLHWSALLLRALDRRIDAISLLERARSANPVDPAIAHSLAQTALEAGLRADHLFVDAVRLAPQRPDILLGLVSARFATGDGSRALDDLGTALVANAGWLDGHRQFAQLATMLGQPDRAFLPLRAAIARFPSNQSLHRLAIDMAFEAEHHDAALTTISAAEAALGPSAALKLDRAAALDELGDVHSAATLFAELGPAQHLGHAVRRLRHLLRAGRISEAVCELDPWLERDGAEAIWPYAALAWRAAGDARSEWLEVQPGLIRSYDLVPGELNIAALAEHLRSLHTGAGRFLDQSVRGGTQTDGPLLARNEPVIAALRRSLQRRVAEYCAGLPRQDPAHPLLGKSRDRIPRFAGSWSVRLTAAGHHASHHHPHGWISSAFYVAVPDGLRGEEAQLALGESPANLKLQLPAHRLIAPRPGRLVLFPSFMWHATRPFVAGERITVAFDVAPP